jgi:hypothetical protein
VSLISIASAPASRSSSRPLSSWSIPTAPVGSSTVTATPHGGQGACQDAEHVGLLARALQRRLPALRVVAQRGPRLLELGDLVLRPLGRRRQGVQQLQHVFLAHARVDVVLLGRLHLHDAREADDGQQHRGRELAARTRLPQRVQQSITSGLRIP